MESYEVVVVVLSVLAPACRYPVEGTAIGDDEVVDVIAFAPSVLNEDECTCFRGLLVSVVESLRAMKPGLRMWSCVLQSANDTSVPI